VKRVVVLLVLACAWSSRAQAEPRADKLFKIGQDQYNAGDFVGAAKSFVAAYQIDADPAYLFNIAQAYRQAKLCAQAASYFKQFVAAVKKPPNPEKIDRLIGEMEACAAKQVATQPAPPPPEPVKQAPPPSPIATGDVVAPPPGPVDVPPDPGSTRRLLGIGIGIAGVAAVATGIGFGAAARSAATQHDAVCTDPCTQWGAGFNDQQKAIDATGHRDAAIAYVGIGVGVAAIAAGVALYVTGRSSETVAVTPTRGGATVSFGVGF
jgi:tetratricopeptide (TPR) repeat protein